MRRGWAKMKKWRGSKSMPPVDEDSGNSGSRNLQSNAMQPSTNPTFPAYKEPASDALADQTFTLRQLELATSSFSPENFIGEGGFGKVYRGFLAEAGQVAIKQMDRHGQQGNREFFVEVLMLSMLHHPNLVNLVGYCADGDQRLLVYEYMSMGSLKDHLHDLQPDQEPLDWGMRMKIAIGAAKGLAYLHEKANPPVIYRDFKPSNILLDDDMNPKLSDFGFAKLAPVGEDTHVSTRVMGTHGYCAPEYAMTGKLTLKSDVYSYGVVLLELITGRKAIDNSKTPSERNLVAWARPLLKDRVRYPEMADPMLKGRFPIRGLYQAIAIATLCLLEDSISRPVISDVVTALSYMNHQLSPDEGVGRQSRRSNVRITPSTPSSNSFSRTPIFNPPSHSPGARSTSSSSSYSSGQDRSGSADLSEERLNSSSGNLRPRNGEERTITFSSGNLRLRNGEERVNSGNLRVRNSEHSGHLRTFSMAEQSNQYTNHVRTNSLHDHDLDSIVTNL